MCTSAVSQNQKLSLSLILISFWQMATPPEEGTMDVSECFPMSLVLTDGWLAGSSIWEPFAGIILVLEVRGLHAVQGSFPPQTLGQSILIPLTSCNFLSRNKSSFFCDK